MTTSTSTGTTKFMPIIRPTVRLPFGGVHAERDGDGLWWGYCNGQRVESSADEVGAWLAAIKEYGITPFEAAERSEELARILGDRGWDGAMDDLRNFSCLLGDAARRAW